MTKQKSSYLISVTMYLSDQSLAELKLNTMLQIQTGTCQVGNNNVSYTVHQVRLIDALRHHTCSLITWGGVTQLLSVALS